jgi:hypothetical protein
MMMILPIAKLMVAYTSGINNIVYEKGYRNNTLTEQQKANNTIKSKTRASS